MKEAIVNSDVSVEIKDSPIPEPGPGELLVKVVVSGSAKPLIPIKSQTADTDSPPGTNPKDWKVPVWRGKSMNSGDDVAGVVEKVGDQVYEFAKGDRVAGFHVMMTDHGTFAEYAIVPAFAAFHIPNDVSSEEAATVPLAAYTAVVALFYTLQLPSPWDLARGTRQPVIIYGASTAIGAFAIKLAKKAGVHPLIAVGSKNSAFVTDPLLNKEQGDAFVDYTQFKSQDELAEKLREVVAATGQRCFKVFDCVSESGSFVMLDKAIRGPPDEATGLRPRIATVLPSDYSAVDPSVEIVHNNVGHVHKDEFDGRLLGLIWGRVFAEGLRTGWMKPHPHEVVNGLEGLSDALKGLKDGTVRAKKMVVRIAEGK